MGLSIPSMVHRVMAIVFVLPILAAVAAVLVLVLVAAAVK